MPEKFPQQTFLSPVIFIASLLIALFIYSKWGPAIPFSVNQITTTKTDLFSVTGEGKVQAIPDIAQIQLGITSSGSSVAQVQSQANIAINNVTAAVKKIGVGDKDIKTTNYNLRPDYDFTAGRQTIKGYVVDINIEVKVRDFAKINDVIDAATGSGANQVGGLSFTIDNPDKFVAQARKQAIDKAKQKAAEIASQTGITLGRIVNVTEEGAPGPRPLPLAGPSLKTADGGALTQIQPGQNEISVTVTLSYETR